MDETKRERYIRILSGLGGADITAEACKELVKLLKEQPDRPRGEWVEDTYGWVYCSHCKKYLDDYQMVFFLKPFDYCPNCGAYMGGKDNE